MRLLPTTPHRPRQAAGSAPLALKPCAQVHRHTSIAWQITSALGGRHGFLYSIFCTLFARARLKHSQEHTTEDGLSCGMLLAMTYPVSHTDPQEDACLRRPRHCQKIYTISMATVKWTGPPSLTRPTLSPGRKSDASAWARTVRCQSK